MFRRSAIGSTAKVYEVIRNCAKVYLIHQYESLGSTTTIAKYIAKCHILQLPTIASNAKSCHVVRPIAMYCEVRGSIAAVYHEPRSTAKLYEVLLNTEVYYQVLQSIAKYF